MARTKTGKERRKWPLTPRQREVATLSAMLLAPADIAERLGYSIYSVRDILKRPDIKDLVLQLQTDRAAKMSDDLMQRILDDGPRNVERIFELRNQDDNLSVAKGAAELLLERQLPRTTRHQEERHVHIHLSREDMAEGQRVLAEAATIEATDYALEP